MNRNDLRWFALCSTIALLSVGLLRSASPAQAHFSGNGLWSRNGSVLLKLNYENNCAPSDWEYYVDQAAYADNGGTIGHSWTSTITPVDFNKVQGNCQPQNQNIDVFTGYDSGKSSSFSWEFSSQYYCVSLVCWWDGATTRLDNAVIRMNAWSGNSFGNLGPFREQAAIAHELGHALGMAHAGYYNGESNGYYSIMDWTNYSYQGPLQHDVDDINHVYPGWV